MANHLVPMFTGIGENSFMRLNEYDNRFLMVAYSSGVIAVFLVFLLLHWNAYRQRGLAGMIYVLEGPFQGINGRLRGSRREKMFPSSTPERP
jgi:hypothetical protein